MKGFNIAGAFAFAGSTRPISGGWTCRRCLLLEKRGMRQIASRGFATGRKGSRDWRSEGQRRKGVVLLASTGVGLGAAAAAFNDDIRHTYETVERSGRVVSALFICINE